MEKPEDAKAAESIWKLMEAVDSYIPTPPRPVDKPFLMPIEDIFTITGRGTVVTGRVERGIVKVGEEIEIVGMQAETKKSVVTGVEMFRKLLDEGRAGDNIGALLRGIDKDEVERGQVLAKPGSIKPHKKFKAEVYVLAKDEGGRHTPFFNGYRPQFYFRTTDVTGVCTLPAGVEMVMPGDNVTMAIELITADRDGEGAAVRDPGGWADGGRGRGRGDRGVARHGHRHRRPEDPHPPQGLRPPPPRPLDEGDRGDGAPHRRARDRARAAAHHHQPVDGAALARTWTRPRASSSRCAPTSGCSTSSIPRPRRWTR